MSERSASGGAGSLAEDAALDYLQRRGLRLVARNYRCKFGEIDLILREGAMLAFVEVRKRRNDQFGGGAASIDTHKRKRLLRTARHYLSAQATLPACRFDAVLLTGDRQPVIEWVVNAFGE